MALVTSYSFAGEEQGSKHNGAIYNQEFKAKLVAIEELLRKVAQEKGE